MATPSPVLSPFATQNAAGFFTAVSEGFVQGVMMDDPASRDWITAATFATSETVPGYGGIGIYVNVTDINQPITNLPQPLGNVAGRATNVTAGAASQLAGFLVFNEAHSGIITPANPVPAYASGQSVNYLPLHSQARIVVAIAPGLVSAILNGSIKTQVSWDFVGQQLTQYQAAYNSASVQSATYTSSTGVLAVTFASAPAGATPTVGAFFSISGMTTSAGSAALVNGDFALVSSGSAGAVLNFNIGSGLGTITINGSTGTLAAGGGALDVDILQVQGSNCKMVSVSSAGALSWNNNAAGALIKLR